MMSPGDYEWKDVERFLGNIGLGGHSQNKQSGNVCQCLERFLVVTTGAGELLVSSG